MYLASVSNTLRIHSSESWSEQFTHNPGTESIRHVEWSDDGKYLLQVNPVGRADINSVTHEGVRCLQCIPDNESSAAAFHTGGHRQIAIGCQSGKIYIWDTKFKSIIKTFTQTSSAVKLLDFNCKNTFLAAGLENGDTAIYGVTTNHQIGIINIPVRLNKVAALKFHHQFRSIIALAYDEGCVLVRDLGNGKNKLFMNDAHKSIVSGITFSKMHDDIMLSCGYDKKMLVYDLRQQSSIGTISTDFALTCVDVNTENYAAVGTTKGQILIYNLRKTSQPFQIINSHDSLVSDVVFQPEVDKRKRYLTMDVSLKECYSPRMNVCPTYAEFRSPEAVKSFEYIDQFNSPIYEMSPKIEKLDQMDGSRDSFLDNIVGDQSVDLNRTQVLFVDSPDEKISKVRDTNSTYKNVLRKSTTFGEKLSEIGTSSSTPIISGRKSSIDVEIPSPLVFGNGVADLRKMDTDQSSNEVCSTQNSPTNKDGVDTISVVETLKPNFMAELGNELKDFITYSIFDVLEQSKNNFMQITMQQTKNRLYLEDQISSLAQRVGELQKNQDVLIEENKRLSIEVELLRSVKD